MAHPMKKEGVTGHNEKLRRMTRDYGAANPSMNKAANVTAQSQEGPQEAQGFGVEGNAMPQRNDRASRRANNANPIATYKTGGRVANRARGGAAKKGATHVNIIVAPQGQGQANAQPNPALAAAGVPPAPPRPPMPPVAGMPGAMPPGLMGPPGLGAAMPPGAMPPGAMPPGAIPPRKRGGSVKHSDEAEDKALVRHMVKPGALKGRAAGGKVHLTAGADSGEGRLEKIAAREKRKAGDKKADLIR